MQQFKLSKLNLSNSQLNKLKPATKIATEVTLKLSSSMIGDSNDETNFPRKTLLTNRKVLQLRKDVANNSSVNIRLSKTQM